MTTKKLPSKNHPSMKQDNKSRATNVTLTVTTYGTEAQRNITIRNLENALKTMGYDVKLSTIRTVSST